MLLFPSFSHCAHLTYNYVDDIVVYVASVAATAAAAAVSYCRSSNNKGRGRRREEEEKRKTMPTSFMCILGSLPLPPLLLMQCTMPIFGPPLILTHSLTLIFAVAFIVGPYISFPAPVPLRISLTYLYGRSCILLFSFFFYCYRFIAICCDSSFQFSSLRSSSFVFLFLFFFISIFIFNLAALIKNSFGVKCSARCPLAAALGFPFGFGSLWSHTTCATLFGFPQSKRKRDPERSSINNPILLFVLRIIIVSFRALETLSSAGLSIIYIEIDISLEFVGYTK